MGSDSKNLPLARELATAQPHGKQEVRRREWHPQQRRGLVEEWTQRCSQSILPEEESVQIQEQQERRCLPKARVRTGAEAAATAKQDADVPQELSVSQRRQEACLMVLKIGTSTLMTEDGGAMHMSVSNIGRFVDLVRKSQPLEDYVEFFRLAVLGSMSRHYFYNGSARHIRLFKYELTEIAPPDVPAVRTGVAYLSSSGGLLLSSPALFIPPFVQKKEAYTVCELRARGHTVVVVSSGAVGAGCVTLHLKQRPEQVNMKQAVASVGQCRLMRLYEDLFGVASLVCILVYDNGVSAFCSPADMLRYYTREYDVRRSFQRDGRYSLREQKVAQVLVSRHDLIHQKSYQNFRSSLRALLTLNVIPVINENDSVATEELRFGDNDTLAAHIAVAVEAKWLFILTDVDCLYDKNPHKHPDARPVALVDRLTDVYAFLSERECGGWGTGGMYTKVVASKIATNMGVHVAITHGEDPFRVLDMLSYVETHFERLATPLLPQGPLQHQSRRPSIASVPSGGKASAGCFEEEGCKISSRKSPFEGGNLTMTTAAATVSLAESSISAVPTVVTASSLDGSFDAALPENACSDITVSARPENGSGSGDFPAATSGEAARSLQCANCDGSGNEAINSSCTSRPCGKNTSQSPCGSFLEGTDRIFPASSSCGDRRGNSNFTARTRNRCNGVGEGGNGASVGFQRESDCSLFLAAASEGKSRVPMLWSEQGEDRQQSRLQLEATSQGFCRATAGQQRQRRLLERDQHEFREKPSSLMVCETIHQMPFLGIHPCLATEDAGALCMVMAHVHAGGTVFLATSLMAHRRGDTKAWILSLPVRGTLFVDKGAVEALVQQKKSLFAAGVRHVVGNFTASECVAVYFDTCYDVRPADSSSSNSTGGRNRLAGKGGSSARRNSSRGINKHHFRNCNGALTDEGKADAGAGGGTWCSGGSAELGRASTSTSHPDNPQKRWGEQGRPLNAGVCRLEKRQNEGSHAIAYACSGAALSEPAISLESSIQEGGQEITASEKHEETSSHKERKQSREGSFGSREKASTRTCVTSLQTASRNPAATPAKEACPADRAVQASSRMSIAISGVDNSLCDGWAACLDETITSECSVMSESNHAAVNYGVDDCMLQDPAQGLTGPPESLEIARCITNFSSAELQVIKGKKSSEFRELLGYPVDEEVAHRQHIVFTFMNGHEVLEQLCLGLACET